MDFAPPRIFMLLFLPETDIWRVNILSGHSSKAGQGVFGAFMAAVMTLPFIGPADARDENTLHTNPPLPTVEEARGILPAGVQNYYHNGSAPGKCALIDGRGTTSPDIHQKMQKIYTALSRFEWGRMAASDLKTSRISACFEAQGLTDRHNRNEKLAATYKPEYGFIQVGINDAPTLMPKILHEWDHKVQGISMVGLPHSPESGARLASFAECGAYTFEAMAAYQADRAGLGFSDVYQTGSHLDRIYNAYARNLPQGEEQAWRAGFDECFFLRKNIHAGIVIHAYQEALEKPELTRAENFGSVELSNEQLMQVAVPPGWDSAVFARAGDKPVSDPFYQRYAEEHEQALKVLTERIRAEETDKQWASWLSPHMLPIDPK